MPLIYEVFDLFNIELAEFTNTNQGESSYFYVNGKSFSSNGKKLLKKSAIFMYLFRLFW